MALLHQEAISGKCRVLCISKDVRNPQPSEEEIKSADFLFHRTYDVGTSRILDTIDDTIAGVDGKHIVFFLLSPFHIQSAICGW